MKRNLLQTSVISIGLKGIGAVLSVLVTALLARLLGVEGFGSYAYVLAVLTLLALPAEAGLPQLVTRETALGLARNEPGKILGLWRWAGRATVLVGGTVIVALTSVQLINDRIFEQHSQIYLAGLALPLVLALAHISAAALRGLRMVVYALLAETLIRPVILLILIYLTVQIHQNITPETAMALHVMALVGASIFGCVVLHRKKPWNREHQPMPRYESRTWLAALLPLSMITGFRLINAQADLILLGLLASSIDVGVFKAMLVLSASLLVAMQAINGVISPYMVTYYEQGKKEQLERLVASSALASFTLMLIPAVIFLLWGERIIALVYGEEYKAGYIALVTLLVGQLFNTAVGPVALLLNMTGYERYTLRGVGVSTFLNITLNVVLIPQYGMMGAAIASALTSISWNLLLFYFVSTKLKMNSSILNPRCLGLARTNK